MSFGTRVAAITIAVSSIGIYATSAAQRTMEPPPAVEEAAPIFEELPVQELAPAEDLYGNEVTPAIAKYKLDAFGVLYEEHSPDTELPRLGIPRS